MSTRLLAAEFDSPHQLRGAIAALRASGVDSIDACTPYEIRGLDRQLRARRSRLPVVGFVGGVLGGAVAYFIQWYVNAWDYPLNAGGRPPHAIPAFVFVTFETLVLCAAGVVFVGLFVRLGMPRYYHPLWHIEGFERVTSDRFWLVVDGAECFVTERCRSVINTFAPVRIVEVETG